jgi:hypothetical protein
MRKIILILSLMIGVVVTSYGQGDCLSSATSINSCGFFYAGNNSTFGDCPGNICGCVGGSTNPSNLDNDCSTVYSGGNCGSDFAGSIENSMFWKFRPSENCDYELCISPTNCTGMGAGIPYMQVWIGQMDTTTGLITQYYVNDNNNSTITTGNTVCYTFPVTQSDGDVVMMVDGNAGTECDISLDINQISCSDTCPVTVIDPVMSINLLSLKIKNVKNGNIITWDVSDQKTDYYNIEKSSDGENYTIITSVNATSEDNASYSFLDKSINKTGYSYYRLKEIGLDGKVFYSQVRTAYNSFELGNIINRYDMFGHEVDENHEGVIIEKYDSGKHRKIINN